jgi:mannose-6-phosphate isomerase-like protein (cupin superfamily)
MTDIKILREYAKNRKLPRFIHLGKFSEDWRQYALDIINTTEDSSDYSLQNRLKSLPGSETDDYSVLDGKYLQKNVFEKMRLPDCLAQFEDIYNFRFAVLEPNAEVPEHLDSPYSYRLISVIEGQHIVWSENHALTMKPGDVYFINGCYKHKVENVTDKQRIAFLAKMPITGHNTYELLRTRT